MIEGFFFGGPSKGPIVGALLALAALGCNESPAKKPSTTKSRSQGVAAKPTASTPAKNAPPKATAAAKKPRKALCAGQLDKPGKDFTDKEISSASAPGVAAPPEKVPVGDGRWTWINFWAAWCVPCKEEMPRLKSWEKKLAGKSPFRLVFVSIDDDRRQLDGFLKSAPDDGVRSTYWLEEGKQREEWLEAVGLDPDPELPVHALVDASGKVRCTILGAVEDGDFDQAAAIVARK